MAAQAPYSPVPSVEPAAAPPNDYNPNRASPESFGAFQAQGRRELAQGEQRLGSAAESASNEGFAVSKFYGQVVADNASNDFQDFSTKLLHGDPNKTNPDGTPDTGYLGSRGRAALDARPQVQQQLDEYLARTRATLKSPEQQLQFDSFSRRLRSNVMEKIGSHADGQFTEWAGNVNQSAINLISASIANNADSEDAYNHGRADLRQAYVKLAQAKGADSAGIQDALRQADQVALEARLNAIGVNDPARAMTLLEQHRAEAGLRYDNLANQFRSRAEQQRGDAAANKALRDTYIAPPQQNAVRYAVLGQAGAPYGVSPDYLQRVHEIEGDGTSPTGARGPFQFVGSTARQYGLKNPDDWAESAAAAAHLTADNRTALTRSLGRVPTDAELYLAHQQGAEGAAKLLANPGVRAGALVGDAAIRVNGGDPNAPAGIFTGMWSQKFNAPTGAARSQAQRAAAFQTIMSDPELSDVARQHAIVRVNQQIAAQQVAEEEDKKATKAQSDQAMDGYVQRLLTGKDTRNIVNEIAADPKLTPEVKWTLGRAASAELTGGEQNFGPGFWNAYKGVTAPVDDPSRITDPNALLKLVSPDTDAEHRITFAGLAKLREMQSVSAHSVNDASVANTKRGLMEYAKSKLSFDQEPLYPGGPQKRDIKGVQAFEGTFIPKFEAAYDAWIKAGKNPWEFLNQKNVDELMKGIRDPREMAQSRLEASGAEPPPEPLPPSPQGVDQKAWSRVMADPPKQSNGQTWPMANWAKAIQILRDNPTPEMQAKFDKRFGPSGYTAKDILGKLPVMKPAVQNNQGNPIVDLGALGIRG